MHKQNKQLTKTFPVNSFKSFTEWKWRLLSWTWLSCWCLCKVETILTSCISMHGSILLIDWHVLTWHSRRNIFTNFFVLSEMTFVQQCNNNIEVAARMLKIWSTGRNFLISLRSDIPCSLQCKHFFSACIVNAHGPSASYVTP